jgi:hypothetical protein
MSPNTDPIWVRQPAIGSILITAANTSSQGGGTIGTDIFLAFTADATNGSWVERVRMMPTATAPTATTATVLRVFVSTQASGTTTSANTYLAAELTVASVNADNASTAVNPHDMPIGFGIEPGQTILVTSHAAPAANTAWRATVIAGDY